jgi:hypothetical protein
MISHTMQRHIPVPCRLYKFAPSYNTHKNFSIHRTENTVIVDYKHEEFNDIWANNPRLFSEFYKLHYAVAQLVEALRYRPEGRGFDSRWCHWNFPAAL